MRSGSSVEPSLTQKPASDLGLGRQKLGSKVLGSCSVCRVEATTSRVLRCRAALLEVQGVADPPGQPLDSLGEAQVVHLAQE